MRRVCLLVATLVLVPCASWPQGNPLGPEFRVNTFTTDNQHQPALDRDAAGNFVAVWASRQDGPGPGSDLGVFGQRYAGSGAPLGPEFRVNTFTTGDQQYPSVTVTDAAGNFVIVWMSHGQDGRDDGIFGQRYAGSGGPLGPEFRVNTWTTDSQVFPSVAADTAGNFVVVWQSDFQDGPNFGVFGQRYSSSGIPVGAEFRVNTYTTGNQSTPAVAADAAGKFVVVWTSYGQDGSSFGVFGQRYASSGAPLGPGFRVTTYTMGSQGSPAVTADSSGNFVVVWDSYGQDGSQSGVFGQRFASSGAPLGSEFRVNTYTTLTQHNPSVASDSAGNFVVVWTSLDNDASFGVFGQRYDDTGGALGPEFRVNTHTPDFQFYADVASESSGNFVVVWMSIPQDGRGAGVFGQRYGPIVPVELTEFTIE